MSCRKKTVPLRTDGTPSIRASVSALWGPKTLEHLDTLDLCFKVETEKSVLRRLQNTDYGKNTSNEIRVQGTISKFALNCGRASTDRQFLYVNGRPCQSNKVRMLCVDHAGSEHFRYSGRYRRLLMRFIARSMRPSLLSLSPISSCHQVSSLRWYHLCRPQIRLLESLDINVSPDKRTIFIHSEDNLVTALKVSQVLWPADVV